MFPTTLVGKQFILSLVGRHVRAFLLLDVEILMISGICCLCNSIELLMKCGHCSSFWKMFRVSSLLIKEHFSNGL